MSNWAANRAAEGERKIERGTFYELARCWDAGEDYRGWYEDPNCFEHRQYLSKAEQSLIESEKRGADTGLLEMGWKHLIHCSYETSWHYFSYPYEASHKVSPTDKGIHLAPWAAALTSHARSCFVISRAAEWFNQRDGAAHAEVVDIDLDGERFTYELGRIDLRPNQVHTVSARYEFSGEIKHNDEVSDFRLPEQAIGDDHRKHRLHLSNRAIFSSRFLNDVRLVLEREKRHTGNPASAAEVEVKDAFIGGPSQVFDLYRATTLELSDIASYYHGRHTFRFGVRARPKFITVTDGSNFGGRFEFADLSHFAAGTAEVFRINRGQPTVSFTQHEADGFFEDQF